MRPGPGKRHVGEVDISGEAGPTGWSNLTYDVSERIHVQMRSIHEGPRKNSR